jgi:hypothetical protein
VTLDPAAIHDSEASAGARRQGLEVVVGAVTTAAGDHDARMWTSRSGAIWSALPFDGGPGDQSLTSVAAGPLGFVAAGVDRQPTGAVPMAWWSADGMSWSRAGLGPGSPFQPGQSISGLAVGPSGVVAVGTIETGGDVDGMAWFSPDGTTWRTVPLGAAGFTGPAAQTVRAVTATTDGFVAVGDDANAERRVAVVWTSADGVTWRRQPPDAAMGELPTGRRTSGVAAGSIAGAGPVLAAGGGSSLQLWSSADGRRWAREESPVKGSPDGVLVATDGRSALAFTPASGLWLRAPGASWARVSADTAVFPVPSHYSSIRSVVRSGDRLVAVGRDGPDNAVWTSTDGRAWARRADSAAGFADGRVDALTALGDLLVGAGTVPTAAGALAAVWTSADHGDTWQAADPGDPAFSVRDVTQIFDVTAGGPGLVAVGLSYTDEIDAQAWFSADGRTWQRASEPAAWSGPGDQALGHVCPLPGGGVLALGASVVRGQSTAWAWSSQDGRSWERVAAEAARPLAAPGAGFLAGCSSSPAGTLVGGGVAGSGGFDGALWRTVDGRTWTALGSPGTFASPDTDSVVATAADGPRIVVSALNGGNLVLYGSADGGSTWARRPATAFEGFGDQVGTDLAIVGGSVVVVGRDGSAAAVWVGPGP